MTAPLPRPRRGRLAALGVAVTIAAALLTGCGGTAGASQDNATYSTEPSDVFPVTVSHKYGETTVPSEPQRVVVVGITEQDVLLELGTPPIATTEWYGEQPYAVWPWATDLLNGAEPTVLSSTDGFAFEKIASLKPDLIVGTNTSMTQDDYTKLSQIAPTITGGDGAEWYFSDWKAQTRLIAQAMGRSAEGDALVAGVEQQYADAAAAHPEFAGLTATFSQGGAYEGSLYVYPAGLNTDFLTDLGFVMTAGLENYVEQEGAQAIISGENLSLIDADVIVFATESAESLPELLNFGTIRSLGAVTGNHAVYTDADLAGAIYFLTPLSQKYVINKLVPRLEKAVAGTSPQSIEG